MITHSPVPPTHPQLCDARTQFSMLKLGPAMLALIVVVVAVVARELRNGENLLLTFLILCLYIFEPRKSES